MSGQRWARELLFQKVEQVLFFLGSLKSSILVAFAALCFVSSLLELSSSSLLEELDTVYPFSCGTENSTFATAQESLPSTSKQLSLCDSSFARPPSSQHGLHNQFVIFTALPCFSPRLLCHHLKLRFRTYRHHIPRLAGRQSS